MKPRPPTLSPEPKPFRFLSQETLLAASLEITSMATREGIAIVLIGGAAMQHYGSDRMTGGIDFAADRVLATLPVSPSGELPFGGIKTATSGVPVSLVVRADDFTQLYQEVIVVSPIVKSLGLRVASPEHLVAMKMIAGRSRDLLDLDFLLAADGVVDTELAREIIGRHLGPYAIVVLGRIIERIAWEKHSGRR